MRPLHFTLLLERPSWACIASNSRLPVHLHLHACQPSGACP